MLKRLFSSGLQKVTVRQALNMALREELKRDDSVFIMGEEVAVFDGAYKVTQGIWKDFGDRRVIDTPITEMGFTGLAIGAAMMDLRPVVEYMTFNFGLQAIDHIINSAAKTLYMSGGDIKCPIVFRGLNGPAASVAAQHSQCLGSMFANIPGLLVISPFDAKDAKGLLKSAIRNDNPVIFLENEFMYGKSFEVNEDFFNSDYLIPIGKAEIVKEGKHCTVISFSRMVEECLLAQQELIKEGVEIEVINLRTLRPLDRNAIINSVKKTSRVVVVEDGYPQHGVGAELISIINEDAFEFLDAKPQRVTAWDVPLPYGKILETAALPWKEHIIKAVKHTLEGHKH